MGNQHHPDQWLQGTQARPEEDTPMGSLESDQLAARRMGCIPVVELGRWVIPARGMMTPEEAQRIPLGHSDPCFELKLQTYANNLFCFI